MLVCVCVRATCVILYIQLRQYCLQYLLLQKPDNSSDVEIGSLIALIVDAGADWKNVVVPADTAVQSKAPASTNDVVPSSGAKTQPNVGSSHNV